jgi:prepilin-type N-terminal cleavage/methylation domain-containing protein
MHGQRQAYTLLEVILVLALLVIITGITLPTILSSYASYRVRAGTDTIRAGFVDARMHAIEDARPYRFAFVPGKGNFRVAPDDPAYWSGSPPQDEKSPPFIREEALPNGIRFSLNDNPVDTQSPSALPIGSVGPEQWTTYVVFEPDGTADNPPSPITLTLTGARPLVITLRGITGTSKVTNGGTN